jgi:hypothetical protein
MLTRRAFLGSALAMPFLSLTPLPRVPPIGLPQDPSVLSSRKGAAATPMSLRGFS